MPREYAVVESPEGFDVVDDRTGEIAMTTEDFDEAYFVAGEMFCDDELMIAHENATQTESRQRAIWRCEDEADDGE